MTFHFLRCQGKWRQIRSRSSCREHPKSSNSLCPSSLSSHQKTSEFVSLCSCVTMQEIPAYSLCNCREQRRHMRKKTTKPKFKTPSTTTCPRTPSRCPGKNALSDLSIVNNGTPAGRPLFVPPGVPGTPGRCPEDFSQIYVPFSFLTN